MEYTCSVCDRKISGDMMVYREHTEKHIIELVKYDHPEWIDENGMCKECVAYYRGELKGSIFGDPACVKRLRKLKKIGSAIGRIFKK